MAYDGFIRLLQFKIVIAIIYYSTLSILTSGVYRALAATLFSEPLAESIKTYDHYRSRRITQELSTVIHVISIKAL
jgi:hypothetical protein